MTACKCHCHQAPVYAVRLVNDLSREREPYEWLMSDGTTRRMSFQTMLNLLFARQRYDRQVRFGTVVRKR